MTIQRKRMPRDRRGITRVFRLPYTRDDGTIEQMRFYFTLNTYDDGSLGEVFVKADKAGSMASGAFETIGMLTSMLLQYGVPLDEITSKLRGMRFPPFGITGDAEIRMCSSPLDLLAQFLQLKFGPKPEQEK